MKPQPKKVFGKEFEMTFTAQEKLALERLNQRQLVEDFSQSMRVTLLKIWREIDELREKNQHHLITIRGLQDTIVGLEKINETLHQAAERSVTSDRQRKPARRVANGVGSKVSHGHRVPARNL